MADSVKKADLVEIKSLSSPPVAVVQVMGAVNIILGEDSSDWRAVKKNVGNVQFLKRMADFDDSSLTPERAQRARELLAPWNRDIVMKVSRAGANFYSWAACKVKDGAEVKTTV